MSDTEDLPDLVASSEEEDSDDLNHPPRATTLEQVVFLWSRQPTSALQSHCHLVKVTVMAPLLFGTVTWLDRWFGWAKALGWFPSQREERVDKLTEMELQFVKMLRRCTDTVLKDLQGKKTQQSSRNVGTILRLSETTKDRREMDGVLRLWRQNELVQKWLKHLSQENRHDQYEKDVVLAIYLTCSQFADQVTKFGKKGENLVEKFEYQSRVNNEKIEDLKLRGNQEFKLENYHQATSTYTQAIRFSPYNPVLYSNRALAYMKTKNYRNALADGLRAVVLKPDYVKGQYRYAEAYYELKKFNEALAINKEALELCAHKPRSEIKDLEAQKLRLLEVSKEQIVEVILHNGRRTLERQTVEIVNEYMDLRQLIASLYEPGTQDRVRDFEGFSEDPDSRDCTSDPINIPRHIPLHEIRTDFGIKYIRINLHKQGHCHTCNRCHENHEACSSDSEDSGIKLKQQSKPTRGTQCHDSDLSSDDEQEPYIKSNRMKNLKRENKAKNESVKKKTGEKETVSMIRKKDKKGKTAKPTISIERTRNSSSSGREMFGPEDAKLKDDLSATLRQGSEDLIECRSRHAVQHYQKALGMIEEHSLKKFALEEIDVVVLKYALSYACVDTGLMKEILEGIGHLNRVLQHATLRFPLACFGLGRAYMRQNRFSEAVDPVRRGLRLLENNVPVDVHTWPGSSTVIQETRPGHLKVALQNLLNRCHYPPRPDAVCRYQHCDTYLKLAIYVSDPDFQGFVRTLCYAYCIIEFHPDCWKKVKSPGKQKLSDKDILGGPCFTPDCTAFIIRIQMFDMNGLEKKTMNEDPPVKEKKVRRPSQKILPSSCKTIARKLERKIARRQKRREARDRKDQDALLKELEKVEQEVLEKEKMSSKSESQDSDPKPLASLDSAATMRSPVLMTKVLKKDNPEDEQYKMARQQKTKVKRKKERSRVVMNLGEFVGQHDYDDEMGPPDADARGVTPPVSSISSSSVAGLDDFDDVRLFSGLDPVNPFMVPSHLQLDVQNFELMSRCSTPASCDSATAAAAEEEKKQKVLKISENLFSYFADFLREHGPLHSDSVVLKRELDMFPPEACQVISDAGGLASFLIQSLQFAMVDDFVCCMSDAVLAKQMADTEKKSLSDLYKKDFPQHCSPAETVTLGGISDQQQSRQTPPGVSAQTIANTGLPAKQSSLGCNPSHISEAKDISNVDLIDLDKVNKMEDKTMKHMSSVASTSSMEINFDESSLRQHSGYTVDRISSDDNTKSKSMDLSPPKKKKKNKKKKKKHEKGEVSSPASNPASTSELKKSEVVDEKIKEQFRKQVHAMVCGDHGDQNEWPETKPVSMETTPKNSSQLDCDAFEASSYEDIMMCREEVAQPAKNSAIPPGFDRLKAHEDQRRSRNEALRSLNSYALSSDSSDFNSSVKLPVTQNTELDLESHTSSTSSAKSGFQLSRSNHLYQWPEKDGAAASASTSMPGPSSVSDIWSNNPSSAAASSTWTILDPRKILRNTRLVNEDSIFDDFLPQPRGADKMASPEGDASVSARDTENINNHNHHEKGATLAQQTGVYNGYNPLGFKPLPNPSYFNPSSSLVPGLGCLIDSSNGDSSLASGSETHWGDASTKLPIYRVYEKSSLRPVGSPAQSNPTETSKNPTNKDLHLPAPKLLPSSVDESAQHNLNLLQSNSITGQHPGNHFSMEHIDNTTPRNTVSVATETDETLVLPGNSKLVVNLRQGCRQDDEIAMMEERWMQLMDKYTQLQKTSSVQIRTLEKALEETQGHLKERDDVIATFKQDMASETKKMAAMKRSIMEEVQVAWQNMQEAQAAKERLEKQLSDKEALIDEVKRDILHTRESLESEKQNLAEVSAMLSEKQSRAIQAEVALLQLKQDVGNQILERSLKDADYHAGQCMRHIKKIQEEHLQPVPPGLFSMYEQWKATVNTIKDTRTKAKAAFEEQISLVRQGHMLSSLPELSIPSPPPAPEMPHNLMFQMPPGGTSARQMTSFPGLHLLSVPRPGSSHHQDSHTPPLHAPRINQLNAPDKPNSPSPPPMLVPPSGSSAPQLPTFSQAYSVSRPPGFMLTAGGNGSTAKQNGAVGGAAPYQAKAKPAKNSFEKIIDTLGRMFPHHSRSELTFFIQQLRDSRNGSLSGMTLQDIVQSVAETILKDQQTKGCKQKPKTNASRGTYKTSQANWSTVAAGGSTVQAQVCDVFEEEEDPCIICHDELLAGRTVRLDCQHRFHEECIRKWFREQSTCPTCRIHALLPDDFPAL